MTLVCPHTVADQATGITLSDDANGSVSLSGLDIPSAQQSALERLLGLWKYGVVEVVDDEVDAVSDPAA